MGNSLSPPPAHETRQKACERAPEFGSAHRRRCTEFGAPAPTRARVFRSGWPRWSPRTESPVLAHLRPHCCTPSLRSLKSVVRRCNTRCSRGGRAPLQMRARPYFGAHAYHTPVLNRSSLRAGIGPPELLRIPLPHALLETGRRPSASHEAREKSCLIMTLSLCEPADHKTRAVTATSTQPGTLLMRLRAIARAEEVHAAPALLSCSSVRD